MRGKIWPFILFSAFGMISTLGFAQARFEASAAKSYYDPADRETYRVDKVGRIIGVSDRMAIACPKQTARTAVFLIAGQSNAANYAKVHFRTAHPSRAVNFFNGKCFSAASPLIGSEGRGGESWTLLADRLIDAGIFDQVVLVTSGIGSTEIDRWREGGDLNRMLLDVVKNVQRTYKITHVLWHQGESDLVKQTTTEDYVTRFASLAHSLRKVDVFAPIYVSVASKCGSAEGWTDTDPVATAQRRLVDPSEGIYAGPDTNALVTPDDRHDKCHFAESGQSKFVAEWVRLLQIKTP
jgi:hypothetical protein